MGKNLGPLNIKDTYEGLVQITSGSIITDGSGSDITYLNITASNADQAGTSGYSVSASFADQAGTAGFASTATSASWADQAGTSGFASTATSASHAVNADTAISASWSDQAGTAGVATTATSASFADQAGTAGFASTATSASWADQSGTSGYSAQAGTAGLAVTASLALDVDSAADLNINSITANSASFVSASIGYLTAVTGSVTKIGDAYILLNTSDVTRYAGIKVEDSGSASPTNFTASLNWDSQTNDWFYEYTSSGDPDNFGIIMFGPEYGTKGSPTYPTANTLVKGNGGHHLLDSSITDDGTDVVVNANITASGYISASTYYGDGSNLDGVSVDTGSLLTTASYSDPTLTFTKGDGSTFDITLATGGAGFPYTGSAEISGSLRVLVDGVADGYTITSGSLSGSLVDNLGTPTGSEAIKHLVYLSQTEYDALTPDSNTMYVISGSGDIVDDLIISGSLIGEVKAISVASSTGSLDCSTGNYFTLGLANAADTRLEASNIQIGQTINIKITNNATAAGTISFGPEFEFEGGSAFTATAATNAVDIITLVSFDGTSLQTVGVKNFS